MNRLSSNATLFWKFFIPVFYISFIGLFLLATLVLEDDLATFSNTWVKVGMVVTYFGFIVLMWKTIMGLKRVEEQEEYFFVSDYFHTYKYAKADIENAYSKNYGLMNVNTIVMRSKTKMGKKIRFIGAPTALESLL